MTQQQRAIVQTGNQVGALIPQTIEEAFRIAGAVSTAGLAPQGMETPERCLIAIMAGAEVGLAPMQAVQNIAVINNRTTIWGDALLGVVEASGLSQYVKEWIEGEGEEMVAYCETLRKGKPEPVIRSFSAAKAMRAGLWQTAEIVTRRKRNGGGTYEAKNDSPWWKYPERMLQMRARALCIRDVYPDVIKGLQVREEVEDYSENVGPDNAKDVTPPPEMAARYSAIPQQVTAQPEGGETGETVSGLSVSPAPIEETPGLGPPGETGESSIDATQTNEDSPEEVAEDEPEGMPEKIVRFAEDLNKLIDKVEEGKTPDQVYKLGAKVKDTWKTDLGEELMDEAALVWNAFECALKLPERREIEFERWQ